MQSVVHGALGRFALLSACVGAWADARSDARGRPGSRSRCRRTAVRAEAADRQADVGRKDRLHVGDVLVHHLVRSS